MYSALKRLFFFFTFFFPQEKVITEGLLTPHKEFKPQKHSLMSSHADNQQHLFQSANKSVAIWVSFYYQGHSALEKQEYLQVHWDRHYNPGQ